jgi:hypothetical protein
MGRTPALALRLKGLVNWPSNVRHPMLSQYVKHIFQNHIVSEPGIRASTTGIWINVTVLEAPMHPLGLKNSVPLDQHPKVKSPVLDFRTVKLENCLGHLETRIKHLLSGFEKEVTDKDGNTETIKKDGHFYYKALAKGAPSHPLAAKNFEQDPMQALQIYRNTPVHLKLNIIKNPLFDAQVLAEYVARGLTANERALPRIFKQLLAKMGNN